MTKLINAVLLASLLATGCNSYGVAKFTDDAFYHVRGHYRVAYADGATRSVVSPQDWTLENYVHDDRGRPGHFSVQPRFWTTYRLEREGRRAERARAELYDLRFVHRRDATVMWVRTVPLSRTQASTDLQVLARDYVERAATGSAVTVDFSTVLEARSRRYGPRILHEGPARVDGRDAYYVIFEHVDLDRREAQPDARGDVVTVVMVRPSGTWYSDGHVGFGSEWPMIMLFGYSSRPEHHARHRDELESLIGRVDLREAPAEG